MDLKIAYALADNQINNTDISNWSNIDENFISKKIGINYRYFLADHESTSHLALKACLKLFNCETANSVTPKIDALVLVTQTPDYSIPHTSAILQGKLGLPDTTACFDISLGCSGYVYALTVCKALIRSENLKRVLLVTSDPYSKIIDKKDRNTIPIFSDAASATLLTQDQEDNVDIGIANLGTCGKKYDHLIVEKSAANCGYGGIWHNDSSYTVTDKNFIRMDGRGIFNFVITNIPKSINSCLIVNKLNISDIDYFCFHQASKFILETLQEIIGFKKEKLLTNISKIGNTVSSSIPILLHDGISSKSFRGKKVLICGFGVGLSWGTNILTFKQNM